ncbi:MAG: beta-lactamase family protein, partial [Kangiellaceae bacterium]|nr:beta-lactamase family protein [Kangiellaceae bacterium]
MKKTISSSLSFTILMIYSVFAVSDSGNRNVQTKLSELVTKLQKDEELVGFGAMVFHQQKLIAETVSGERKIDSGVALSLTDQWHIGSVTKSVTATMIGRLVETGQLNWQTTVADIFTKEVKSGEIAKSWRRAT